MSAALRGELVREFNRFYSKRTLSGGVAYISVRVPYRTVETALFNGMVRSINEAGGASIPASDLESVIVPPARKLFDDFYKQKVTPFVGRTPPRITAWKILKAEVTNDIIYIECMKEPSAAPKYNIENAHRWWREQLAKFIAKDPNLKKTYLTFEHGSTREGNFAAPQDQSGQVRMDFNKAARKEVMGMDKRTKKAKALVQDAFADNTINNNAAKSAGASGTIVDKSITYAAKAIQTSGDKTLGMLTKVLKGTLTDYFNYDHSVNQNRSMTQILDEFVIQGSIYPSELGQNTGAFDSGIADLFRRTFGSKKGQDEFVRIAQKYVKGLGGKGKRAQKLWSDSQGPVDALEAISKKQIIDNLFPHKTTPNMRYKVNKKLAKSGRKALKKKKGKVRTEKGNKASAGGKSIAAASVARTRLKKNAQQRSQGKTAQSPIELRNLLNEMLPEMVASKMTSPALRFRTGRFANSARVENVTVGSRGGIGVDYTYMRDPYETFEPGNKQGSTHRDPRKIIGASIRELAMGILGRQPTTIRRT